MSQCQPNYQYSTTKNNQLQRASQSVQAVYEFMVEEKHKKIGNRFFFTYSIYYMYFMYLGWTFEENIK